uniref:Protein kinase domain-containing protein n=1 Tax=Mucochytrium quahogii TaxID=96639 RepID=A0A7S2WR19_9STRA|mmetsp:Transcript_23370/g.37292  ORF Transcript_23370/g.37292 Transcript_23370/m.37292 type:complete len:1302 (+) Transcript_23370:417-4322(+)
MGVEEERVTPGGNNAISRAAAAAVASIANRAAKFSRKQQSKGVDLGLEESSKSEGTLLGRRTSSSSQSSAHQSVKSQSSKQKFDFNNIRAAAAAAAASRTRRASGEKESIGGKLSFVKRAFGKENSARKTGGSGRSIPPVNLGNFENGIREDLALTALGRGVQTALEFLSSSDKDIRTRAGVCVSLLIHDCDRSALYESQETDDGAVHLSQQEMEALKILGMSKTPSVRQVAANVVGEFASREALPRGSTSLKKLLEKATTLVMTNECTLQIFAIRIATDLAAKGTIWQERLLEQDWLSIIIGLINQTIRARTETRNRSRKDGDSTEEESRPKRPTLRFREGEKRLLKMSFEFLRTLDLDQAEKTLRRQKKFREVDILNQQRLELIDMLSGMCSRCSLQAHTSLLKVLFGALRGLVKNITTQQWDDGLGEHFASFSLGIILDRAEEAARQYQALAATILSHSMMQGDLDENHIEINEDEERDEEGNFTPEPAASPSGLMSFSSGNSVHRQQIYRQNQMYTSSNFSLSSLNVDKQDASPRHTFTPVEANNSSHLLLKKLSLVTLTMEALQVVQYACMNSRTIANSCAEMFEIHGVMRVLNMLYRSEVPGAKTEAAQFLYAICQNITDDRKILLCESGVIIRLLRLASPSGVYGKNVPGGLASSDESAFIPAVKAIASLASVDVIGARIIIAGGLGPLHSHANSTRETRLVAKEALDALGVTNINDLVDLWAQHLKEGAARRQLMSGGGTIPEEFARPPKPQRPPPPGRNKKLHAYSNSTTSFFQAPQTVPRSVRVFGLMSSWRRGDGKSIVLDAEALCGDPSGTSPWKTNATVLGSGAFSTVYKAYIRKDQLSSSKTQGSDDEEDEEKAMHVNDSYQAVAVKKLTDAAFADDSFLEEIKILSKVPRHRYISNLHGVILSENTVLIISELGGPHTLAWHLATSAEDAGRTSQKVSPLCNSWIARIKVLNGIAEAIKTLQLMNPAVLHLDLKSSNVLISDLGNGRFVPKLCDFGLAVELKTGYGFLNPANHGTLQWMAPEVMRDEDVELSKGFDQSADTFSFAIVMWEVAHPGRVPWDELAVDVNLDSIQDRIRELVCGGRRLQCYNSKSWPAGYESLMRKCWRQNPLERPCFVRSFLCDPDSFGMVRQRYSHRGETAGQETIDTSLKRILWERKSANRISLGVKDLQSVRRQRPHLSSYSSHDTNDSQGDGLAPLPMKQFKTVDSKAETLRRQSSIIGHNRINPHLEFSFDYHDHDHEFESSGYNTDGEDSSQNDSSSAHTGRPLSSSIDESTLSTFNARKYI